MGGNADLSAEEADIFTAGAVYQPRWADGLSLTLDYWDTEVTNAISTIGAQTILDNCHATGENCDLIDRWGTGSGATVGDVRFIHNLNANVGAVEASGMDLAARYAMPETDFGRFSVSVEGAYLEAYDKTLANGDVVSHAGRFEDNHDGNFPRWRWNTGVDWSFRNWDARWTVRYIDSVTEPLAQWYHTTPTERTVSSQTVHDIQASYDLEAYGTRLTLGVDNVADKQPPFADSGFNDNTDVRTYETIGRFYYGRLELSL